MGRNREYIEWLQNRTAEYYDAVEDLMFKYFEDRIDRQTLTDITNELFNMGTTYMSDVVVKEKGWGFDEQQNQN